MGFSVTFLRPFFLDFGVFLLRIVYPPSFVFVRWAAGLMQLEAQQWPNSASAPDEKQVMVQPRDSLVRLDSLFAAGSAELIIYSTPGESFNTRWNRTQQGPL
jgi:hypothetical protein